jgi:hypothetical protein
MRALLLLLFVGFASSAGAQGNSAVDAFVNSRIRPNFDAYLACAATELEKQARANPSLSFDRVEPTLKPACGVHVDRVRDALRSVNVTAPAANRIIRDWYTKQQPSLLSYFTAKVETELQRRASARLDAERREQERQAGQESERLLAQAVKDHDDCVRRELVGLVPYSNESSEVLASVIMTKCEDHERKRVSLGVALYGLTRQAAEKSVAETAGRMRREVVALIVSLRADLAKAQSGSNPKPTESGI